VPVLGLIFLRYADYKFGLAEKELAGKSTGRRQGPVVILPLEYLELSTYWKAGIRQRRARHEVFHVEWVLPRADIETVGKADVCYSML